MKHVYIIGIVGLLVLGALAFSRETGVNTENTGGVQVGSEYQGTQITSADVNLASTTVAKSGNTAVLGSVIITIPATSGTFTLYNATSTAHSTSTAEVLADFNSASDVAGTYEFNLASPLGLFYEVTAGFNGEYTVTWR